MDLIEQLRYHNYRYYQLNQPVISDSDYDKLYQKFLVLKEKYPDLADPIGYPVVGEKVTHISTMLSLRSVNDSINVSAAFVNIGPDEELSLEPKNDGIAVELIYRNHILQTASTRGDGFVGEDITANVISIDSIPTTIHDGSDIEVYGELYLLKSDLEKFNLQRVKNGGAPYSNTRNAVAGIVRSKNQSEYLSRIKFFPYTVNGCMNLSQTENFKWMDDNGFDTLRWIRKVGTVDDIDNYIRDFEYKLRDDLDFDIDGLVFKVDSIERQDEIGMSSKHPKWAIAYKFSPALATSRLDDVIFQIGKSGIVAPVGIIDPVEIGNVRVTRVSLANINRIKEKGVMIGDTITIERANDVIPYLVGPVIEERTGNEIEIVFPEGCPACDKPLIFETPHYLCTNSNCPGQIVGKLIVGVSRKGFNIFGLGPKRVSEFVEHGILQNLSDVFDLDSEYNRTVMKEVIGYTDATINNLIANINRAREIQLFKFIRALCIPGVDEITSMKLTEVYHTASNMLDLRTNPVQNIRGLTSSTQDHISNWFQDESHVSMFTNLLTKVKVIPYKKTTGLDSVAITGSLSVPRDQVVMNILNSGFSFSRSIGSRTNYLVVGDNPSESKLEKARKFNVRLIPEDELTKVISKEGI